MKLVLRVNKVQLVLEVMLVHVVQSVHLARTVTMADLVQADADLLRKADVVVAYAKALIVVGDRYQTGTPEEARSVANGMADWLEVQAKALDDDEVRDMAGLMRRYESNLR